MGIIIPTDFHIFQRGWNHQPAYLHGFQGQSLQEWGLLGWLPPTWAQRWIRQTATPSLRQGAVGWGMMGPARAHWCDTARWAKGRLTSGHNIKIKLKETAWIIGFCACLFCKLLGQVHYKICIIYNNYLLYDIIYAHRSMDMRAWETLQARKACRPIEWTWFQWELSHGRILLSHRIRLQGASHEPWVWQAKCVMKLWRCKCVAVGEKMWEALKSFESENQINIDKLCDIKNHEKITIRYSIESIDTSSENVKSAACLWPCHRHRHRASRIWQVPWRISSKQMRSLRYGAFQRDSTKAEGEDMVVSYIKKKLSGYIRIHQNMSD